MRLALSATQVRRGEKMGKGEIGKRRASADIPECMTDGRTGNRKRMITWEKKADRSMISSKPFLIELLMTLPLAV